jgi:hypothetical protein
MRGLLTFALVAVLSLALFVLLRGATGDALSAAVIELVLLITLGTPFSRLDGKGRPA